MSSVIRGDMPSLLTPAERMQTFLKGIPPENVQETPNRRLNADLQNTSIFFFVSAIAGIALVISHSVNSKVDHTAGDYAPWTTVCLWALACLASGAAFGFLFGIPKVRQQYKLLRTSGNAPVPADTDYHQQVNTNLEDIQIGSPKSLSG